MTVDDPLMGDWSGPADQLYFDEMARRQAVVDGVAWPGAQLPNGRAPDEAPQADMPWDDRVPVVPAATRGASGRDHPEPAALDDRVSYRTLADVDDSPPRELLLGMLEPDGPTTLNAAGGTGKGTTGAWMCGELLALGMRPIIYDPENRPREWARRTSGLGIDHSGSCTRSLSTCQPRCLASPCGRRPRTSGRWPGPPVPTCCSWTRSCRASGWARSA